MLIVESKRRPLQVEGIWKAVVASDLFTPFRVEQRLHGQRQGALLLPSVVFERLMTQEPCGAGERLALILVLRLKQVDVAQDERTIEPQGQGRAVLRIMRTSRTALKRKA